MRRNRARSSPEVLFGRWALGPISWMVGSWQIPGWDRASAQFCGRICVGVQKIRNGLYLASTRFLDGVEAYNRHVMVLRDGTMRGGGGFYYTVGSYTCSDGKWKGEMTSREHSPIPGTYPWARKEISIGFTGTYSDDGAEFDATAFAGKRSFRFKSVYKLLFAD